MPSLLKAERSGIRDSSRSVVHLRYLRLAGLEGTALRLVTGTVRLRDRYSGMGPF